METGKIALLVSLGTILAVGISAVTLSMDFAELEGKMDLMSAEIEDTKHENVMNRINNAIEILDGCKFPEELNNSISKTLYDAQIEATLKQNYDEAESIFNSVLTHLIDCDPPGGTFLAKPLGVIAKGDAILRYLIDGEGNFLASLSGEEEYMVSSLSALSDEEFASFEAELVMAIDNFEINNATDRAFELEEQYERIKEQIKSLNKTE